MPIGSLHDETGLLLENRGKLSLRRDAGGVWRLDAPASAYRMVGQRVRMTGRRIDFDLLEVDAVQLSPIIPR